MDAVAAITTTRRPARSFQHQHQCQGQPSAPALMLLPVPREAQASADFTRTMLQRFRADPLALRVAVEREARAARLLAVRQAFAPLLRALTQKRRAPALP